MKIRIGNSLNMVTLSNKERRRIVTLFLKGYSVFSFIEDYKFSCMCFIKVHVMKYFN